MAPSLTCSTRHVSLRRNPTVARFDIDWDRHLLALQRELLEQRYCPALWRLHAIGAPKVRLIAAPAVRDRVVHHAVLQEIGPVFERSYLEQSFAAGHGSRATPRGALLSQMPAEVSVALASRHQRLFSERQPCQVAGVTGPSHR